MVLRLFVPPGEGQHRLVPKRPDTIGANATLQSCLVSSTLLAAVYTSLASTFNHRVAPQQAIRPSKPALFVRSSARLGLCVGLAGAAVNWYYYSSFANVVVAEKVHEVKKWRPYERSVRYTVDDGVLAGAALGFSASLPMLLGRRLPTIPRWTRCLGMTNIGACTGVLGAHAYFQYTGERQRAYKRLDAQRKRRSLEFWAIFWDKELMAKLSPIMQQYVRHNGVWYAQLLPDDVFERMDDDEADETAVQTTKQISNVDTEQKPDLPFYFEPVDYTADLKQINVEGTKLRIEEMEVEREVLLEEAEYLLFINAQQRYEYCHKNDTMDADERLRRLQEIHLVDVAYNRLRNAADALDMKIIHWRMSLQHKAAWEESSSCSSPNDQSAADATAWLPEPHHLTNPTTHRPSFSALEIEKLQAQIHAEVQRFEQGSADARYAREKRERWRKDAEDGRVILRAADHVLFRMAKASEGNENRVQSGRDKVSTTVTAAKTVVTAEGSSAAAAASPGKEIHPVNESKPTTGNDDDDDDNDTSRTMDDMRLRKEVEQSRADAQKAAKPHRESLEPNKP